MNAIILRIGPQKRRKFLKISIKNIVYIVLRFYILIACLSVETNYAILNSAFAEFYQAKCEYKAFAHISSEEFPGSVGIAVQSLDLHTAGT